MPKQSQRAEVNKFIAGLITEASPLNFPQNASADEQNFELNRDGSRQRRLGMDFEASHQITQVAPNAAGTNGMAFNSFTWNSVNGDPKVSLLAVQSGIVVSIYNLNQDTISQGGPLVTYYMPFAQGAQFSFASVEGFLVVAGGGDSYAVISCDTTANPKVFVIEFQRLQVRDVWGAYNADNPGMETNIVYHPAVLSNYHNYNLRNQSWGIPRKDTGGGLVDPVALYVRDLGYYPNSVEQVWVGLQEQPVSAGQQPFERIFTNLYQDADGANTKIARGHFVIDLLNRGASRVNAFNAMVAQYSTTMGGSITLPQDYTSGGPSCVETFAGRIFFSGFQGAVTGGDPRSPNLDNYVTFSQLVKNKGDFNKCYTEGDPTSRDSNDIVDTDGGFVRLDGARNILGMVNLQTHLIIIAENGVWTVTGGSVDSGFSATNYKVAKISTFGGISASSIVTQGDSCFYWSQDGIYSVSKNQYGDMQVDSITLATIQTLYDEIPASAKLSSSGKYDQFSKKVRWIYKTGTLFSADSVTNELIFDVATKAITRNLIFNTVDFGVEVVGIVSTNATKPTLSNEEVFAATDQVFVNTNDVIINTNVISNNIVSLKYLTLVKSSIIGLTFSYYKESTFTDWFTYDGVGADAFAYCLTGTVTANDTGVDKQIPYLIMHFERTENGVDANYQPINQSGCLFRGQWSFANSIVSNKWTPLREAYKYRKPLLVASLLDTYDNGFEVITSKNKLRGKGPAFALYFETEAKKDCRILGWSVTLNANQIT